MKEKIIITNGTDEYDADDRGDMLRLWFNIMNETGVVIHLLRGIAWWELIDFSNAGDDECCPLPDGYSVEIRKEPV